jgi:hypothetical protein
VSHDDLLYRLLADARPAALLRALAEQLLQSVGWLSSESDHLTLEPGGDLEPPLTEWGCLSVAVGPDAAGSE